MLLMLLQDDGTPAERLDAMIKAVAGGDRTALADLYSETRSGVYGFALSMLRNSHDAEDVLQEAYIRVWNSAASYVPKGTPMSWLLSIAKNLALMKLRARGRQAELEPEEWSAISVPDSAASINDRHLLEAALSILSSDECQIVMLHAVSGVKHKELASLMDMPLPTVLSKYHRTLKKLRKYMEGVDAND